MAINGYRESVHDGEHSSPSPDVQSIESSRLQSLARSSRAPSEVRHDRSSTSPPLRLYHPFDLVSSSAGKCVPISPSATYVAGAVNMPLRKYSSRRSRSSIATSTTTATTTTAAMNELLSSHAEREVSQEQSELTSSAAPVPCASSDGVSSSHATSLPVSASSCRMASYCEHVSTSSARSGLDGNTPDVHDMQSSDDNTRSGVDATYLSALTQQEQEQQQEQCHEDWSSAQSMTVHISHAMIGLAREKACAKRIDTTNELEGMYCTETGHEDESDKTKTARAKRSTHARTELPVEETEDAKQTWSSHGCAQVAFSRHWSSHATGNAASEPACLLRRQDPTWPSASVSSSQCAQEYCPASNTILSQQTAQATSSMQTSLLPTHGKTNVLAVNDKSSNNRSRHYDNSNKGDGTVLHLSEETSDENGKEEKNSDVTSTTTSSSSSVVAGRESSEDDTYDNIDMHDNIDALHGAASSSSWLGLVQSLNTTQRRLQKHKELVGGSCAAGQHVFFSVEQCIRYPLETAEDVTRPHQRDDSVSQAGCTSPSICCTYVTPVPVDDELHDIRIDDAATTTINRIRTMCADSHTDNTSDTNDSNRDGNMSNDVDSKMDESVRTSAQGTRNSNDNTQPTVHSLADAEINRDTVVNSDATIPDANFADKDSSSSNSNVNNMSSNTSNATHGSAAFLTSAVALQLDATINPAISVFALTTLIDPVSGESVLGLGMGANTGHVDYVELGLCRAGKQSRELQRCGNTTTAVPRRRENLHRARQRRRSSKGETDTVEEDDHPVRECSEEEDGVPADLCWAQEICPRRGSTSSCSQDDRDLRIRYSSVDSLSDGSHRSSPCQNDDGSNRRNISTTTNDESSNHDLLSTTSTVNTMEVTEEDEEEAAAAAAGHGMNRSARCTADRHMRRQLDLRHGKRLLRHHAHRAHVQSINALTSAVELPGVRCMCFLRAHDSPATLSYLTASEHVIKLFRVRRAGCSALDWFPEMSEVVDTTFHGSRYYARLPPFPPATAPSRHSDLSYHNCSASAIHPVREFGPVANNIQSLDVSADGVTFMSVEDLQVFWWHLESGETNRGTCIADFRPASGELSEVEELVTAAAFHPSHGSLFLLSRSSGVLNIGDLRDPPLRQPRQYALTARILPEYNPIEHASYNEILCSISAAAFMGDNHVVTRDYVSLKLWDLRQARCPVSMVPVMDYVGAYLDTLYKCDSIFDRFHVAIDAESATVVTGLYDGAVAVWQPFCCNSEEFSSTDDGARKTCETSAMRQRSTLHFEVNSSPDEQQQRDAREEELQNDEDEQDEEYADADQTTKPGTTTTGPAATPQLASARSLFSSPSAWSVCSSSVRATSNSALVHYRIDPDTLDPSSSHAARRPSAIRDSHDNSDAYGDRYSRAYSLDKKDAAADGAATRVGSQVTVQTLERLLRERWFDVRQDNTANPPELASHNAQASNAHCAHDTIGSTDHADGALSSMSHTDDDGNNKPAGSAEKGAVFHAAVSMPECRAHGSPSSACANPHDADPINYTSVESATGGGGGVIVSINGESTSESHDCHESWMEQEPHPLLQHPQQSGDATAEDGPTRVQTEESTTVAAVDAGPEEAGVDKVLSIAIAPGGSHFAYTMSNGKVLCIFERSMAPSK